MKQVEIGTGADIVADRFDALCAEIDPLARRAALSSLRKAGTQPGLFFVNARPAGDIVRKAGMAAALMGPAGQDPTDGEPERNVLLELVKTR